MRASMPRARWTCVLLGAAALATPRASSALEFFDGRLEVHGFYEAQVRSLVRDYDLGDDWDLTQWWNVLNVEIESNIAPDGFGPFDLISGFTRVEVRYDCVWTRACTLFDGADAYGRRAERLPRRLIDARRGGRSFQLPTGDTRHFYGVDREQLGIEFGVPPPAGFRGAPNPDPPPKTLGRRGSRTPLELFQVPGFDGLFGIDGPLGIPNQLDPLDPAQAVFSPITGCRFGARKLEGTVRGNASQVLVHSVDEDDCFIDPDASLGRKPNPFRGATDFYGNANTNLVPQGPARGPDGMTGTPDDVPVLQGDYNPVIDSVGGFDLPLRPAPRFASNERRAESEAGGVWYPNSEFRRLQREGEFDNFDQNYDERSELAWNRGASQQDTKELKEAYLDLEAFDSRLWLRLGKQQIVWGKTELFRTTDQFNPQDLALGSLTSLEESRIALWSVRAIWSFFEVGPAEDVRLELGANIQDFEPNDLGRCGEPYSPLPVCDKTFGLMAHGLAGVALAGEIRPDDAWDGTEGFELGARLEFRYERFSFALIDFWGYEDLPYADQVFRYTRNVDPESGRPRALMTEQPCITGLEGDCLIGRNPGDVDPSTGLPRPSQAQFDAGGNLVVPGWQDGALGKDALENHSVGQQYFALICSTSIGFNDLDRTACGQSVFNSTRNAVTGAPLDPDTVLTDRFPSVSELLANAVAGNPGANGALIVLAGVPVPGLALNVDDCDGFLSDCEDRLAMGLGPNGPLASTIFGNTGPTLNGVLTSQQQALLGCGEFYGTNCELHGIDLLNTEASVVMQSLLGIEGTPVARSLEEYFAIGPFGDEDTFRGQPFAQPGTLGFQGGPVCTRFERNQPFILPGCRGPGPDLVEGTEDDDPGYSRLVDGSVGGLLHPLTGQQFKSEMAALSFNAIMALVALSTPDATDGDPTPTIAEFDSTNPLRHDGCSFAVPHLCVNVGAFDTITGVQRNSVRAAGNGRFGRRDFLWHGGEDLVLRYQKRNVLGLSADFAEDTTKTNWGIEFTWIPGLPTGNNDEIDANSETNQFNLTVAIDRPTFVNFLNPNRTFFITTQWFLQYLDGYRGGMPSTGPYNVLAILNISSGYFQDRLIPDVTFVYDVQSDSGAVLTSIDYRFTENFSTGVGIAAFMGRFQEQTTPITPVSLDNRVGKGAYKAHVENGLSVIRERDELFLRVRYTF